MWLVKQNSKLNFHICPGSSKVNFINICQRHFMPIVFIKWKHQNWCKSTLNFETKLNISKIQNKIMVSFIILLGDTLIIFIITEQVLMPQLICQRQLLVKQRNKFEN